VAVRPVKGKKCPGSPELPAFFPVFRASGVGDRRKKQVQGIASISWSAKSTLNGDDSVSVQVVPPNDIGGRERGARARPSFWLSFPLPRRLPLFPNVGARAKRPGPPLGWHDGAVMNDHGREARDLGAWRDTRRRPGGPGPGRIHDRGPNEPAARWRARQARERLWPAGPADSRRSAPRNCPGCRGGAQPLPDRDGGRRLKPVPSRTFSRRARRRAGDVPRATAQTPKDRSHAPRAGQVAAGSID
jgi:hypothetical protein